jgi:PAS domain S-box-containing protein
MKSYAVLGFKKILDSVADGVFTVDRKMHITFFNRAASRITGVPPEEAIGRPCSEVFRADICQSTCALRRSFETGREIVNLRVEIRGVEGARRIPISISTAVLRDEAGEIIGGVETFRDLSVEEELRKEIESRYTWQDIVSKNHRMQELFAILPNVAESESTVLIEGESGTGKELVARAIHDLSARRKGPYVAVNCAALPDTLLESELFGYVKGAFTDAKKDKPGRFARARGGTIFLDEVGSISPVLQVKLLRVIQERQYEPLGAVAQVPADVRIVAATNRDLASLLQEGAFRDDLYYRLNVVKIKLPPLRSRSEDIPLLAEHFVRRFNAKQRKAIAGLSEGALTVLMGHSWPGNVRELENVIEHAFVMCRKGLIQPDHLPRDLRGRPRAEGPSPLASAEKDALQQVLSRHRGDRGAAAAELGLHRTTLWRKLRRHGLA